MTDLTALEPHLVLEPYRLELITFCYRKLGSTSDAEDAAQETLLRAWRSIHRFEQRAKLRTWLYCIASNVCIDMLRARSRRPVPMDLGQPERASRPVHPGTEPRHLPGGEAVGTVERDPAEKAIERDLVRLAFAALVRNLPARQRAVVILREALGWGAAEIAELLDMTVAAVNSALQRARTTLAAAESPALTDRDYDDGHSEPTLAAQYGEALMGYDFDELVNLVRDDFSMREVA